MTSSQQPAPEPASGPKVLCCLHSFDPAGVERVALRLCTAWRSAGADVTVLMGRLGGPLREEARDLDYVSYSSGPIPTRHFETTWMIACALRRVRENRPDVIFCAGNTYTVVAAALRLALGEACPPIIGKVSNSLARNDMPALLRRAYELWLRAHGRAIDTWVAMSESLRPEIGVLMGVPDHRLAVVDDPALSFPEHRALAAHRDERSGRPRKGRLIVSAGRLVPQKRFDLLIRAFCKSSGEGDRLVILGDGPHRPALQTLVRKLSRKGRIRLIGHSPDVSRWLARADLLALASDYEGLPAIVIEALASGVPILATQCSAAMDDLIGRGQFGRLVPCNDEESFANAIRLPPPAGFRVEDARKAAERHLVERAAPAYLRLFADAMNRRNARRAPAPVLGAVARPSVLDAASASVGVAT